MNCPTCPSVVLVIADRSGIEIDYCPTCRGVWLDRGELDKIIERSFAAVPHDVRVEAQRESALPLPAPVREYDDDDDDDGRRFQHGDQRSTEHRRNKRKKGFLGDLFDF